jgi:TonB family protein
MKTRDCIRGVLMAWVVFPLLPHSASAFQPAAVGPASGFYLQEGGGGAPLGKLNVPANVMASHCTTMVSPNYPQTADGSPAASTVIVRVVIWKSGNVSPMRVVSGPSSLQDEAMNTVRLWRYRPFARDGEPVDVTTDIRVDFDPAKPGGVVTHPNR